MNKIRSKRTMLARAIFDGTLCGLFYVLIIGYCLGQSNVFVQTIIYATIMMLTFFALQYNEQVRRLAKGRHICVYCGYNLKGIRTKNCPECGGEIRGIDKSE